MFDIKSGHCTVTSIKQHVSAKFHNYFSLFRVRKRSKFLCFLSCWHEKRSSLAGVDKTWTPLSGPPFDPFLDPLDFCVNIRIATRPTKIVVITELTWKQNILFRTTVGHVVASGSHSSAKTLAVYNARLIPTFLFSSVLNKSDQQLSKYPQKLCSSPLFCFRSNHVSTVHPSSSVKLKVWNYRWIKQRAMLQSSLHCVTIFTNLTVWISYYIGREYIDSLINVLSPYIVP